jgi:hypothetical protein
MAGAGELTEARVRLRGHDRELEAAGAALLAHRPVAATEQPLTQA